MLIKVTQDDIDTGQRRHPLFCPVSLAVQRTLNTKHVLVSVVDIEINYGTEDDKVAKLPEDISDIIRDYDDGEDMFPFEFEAEFKEKWEK
jgi:hypothetical protein